MGRSRICFVLASLSIVVVSACIPSRSSRVTPAHPAPPPPVWARPAPPPSPAREPVGAQTSQGFLPPVPPVQACRTDYVPPFPAPLAWRVAYRGVGDTFHHCPDWSRFGPVRPNGKWHKGIDLAAPTGTPVLAAVSGTVSYARDPKGWGLYANVTFRPVHPGPNGVCQEGEPMRFVYAHLVDDDPDLVTGEERPVHAGEVIGRVGCSGNATKMCSPSPESHLHLTLRRAKGDRAKVDALSVVGWQLVTPPPVAFQPALRACPM